MQFWLSSHNSNNIKTMKLKLILFTCLLLWQEVHSQIELQWQYLDLGNGAGYRGTVVGDFDDNGYVETFLVANENRDIMSVQYNGYGYKADKVLPRPADGDGVDSELEIHSLAHLKTDADYGLVVTEDKEMVFIYDLGTTELVDTVDVAGYNGSFHLGIHNKH